MATLSQIKASDNVTYNIRDDYSTWGGRNLLLGTKTQDTSVGNNNENCTATSTSFKGCTVFTSKTA